MSCGIYRLAASFEVCIGCGDDDMMRTRLVATLLRARAVAEEWRAAFLANGFTEAPP